MVAQKTFGQAFAPAHISGIFIIDMKKDYRLSGSMGCGVCLEDGATTKVSVSDKTTVRINGVATEATTTLSAINLLTSKPILVETKLDMPIGGGLGASAAGALSTVLALNEALSLGKTFNELVQAAHTAEVMNRTGLGDVAGQACGGFDIRRKAGIPPIGIVDKIPCKAVTVSWLSFGGISTKSVLSDEARRKIINDAGKRRLKELLKRPTVENFFRQSSAFAKEIELMSPKARDAIEAVESSGGLASQSMLGDTVFAIDNNEALSEFGTVRKSSVSAAGAHLL